MAIKSESIISAINVIIHLIGSLQFCFGVYYHWFHVNIPANISPLDSAFGDKLKYLTFWNACIQAFYFTLSSVIDLFVKTSSNKPPTIVKFKHFLFATIGFPIACFVSTVFWGIYLINRELVLPRAIDPYFPLWLNHLVHTMVMLFVVLEMLTASRPYPKRSHGLATLGIFTLIYVIWVHVIYAKSGYWVYPILSKLSLPLRILFFGAMVSFSSLLYFFGEFLNKLSSKTLRKDKKKKR